MKSEPESEARIKELLQEHRKSIRTKCLLQLMALDYIFRQRYKDLKDDYPDYLTYLKEKQRIEDAQKIIGWKEERTARDYRDALIYFSN